MEEDDDIKNIRNYVFSFALEMGFDNFVEYSEEMKEYYAKLEFDDDPSVRDLIERYDEHSAWGEFVDMLGERDFFRKFTRAERRAMSDKEHFMELSECENVWDEEFAEHGIDRLEINEEE